MKKIIPLFLALLLAPSVSYSYQNVRDRQHATDCTSITDGRDADLCYEKDSQNLYKCQPDGVDGLCDTPGEWKKAGTFSLGELTGFGTITYTAGDILVADGTDYESVQMNGDATMNSSGAMSLASNSVGVAELSDINSVTKTAGNLFVADGTDFESMIIQGDISLDGAGFATINSNSVGSSEITDGSITVDDLGTDSVDSDEISAGAVGVSELADFNSLTQGAGRVLISDGTDFESMQIQGDVTVDGSGFTTIGANAVGSSEIIDSSITSSDLADGSVGVSQLADINSLTQGEGRLLVSDGTNFESMQISGDATINGVGSLQLEADSVGSAEIAADAVTSSELSDFGTMTQTAGNMLVSDGTTFESVTMSGDIEVDGNGMVSLTGNSVATEEIVDSTITSSDIQDGTIAVDDMAFINSATITAGRILVADGTEFESMQLQGSCSLNGAGFISCTDNGATQLTELSDVNSAGITAGNILVADGTEFESVAVSGDATLGSDGALSLANDSVDSAEIAANAVGTSEISFINTSTATAGRIFVADGTDFESQALTGDCTLDGTGYMTCTTTPPSALDDLTDVNTATATAGRLMIADGTDWESMQLQGDCTMDGAGFITCPGAGGGVSQLSELTDVSTSTKTAGNVLVADGTNFASVSISGDATLSGAGALSLAADSVGSSEIAASAVGVSELADINSATKTAGRLFIADGTDFESMAMQGDCSLIADGTIDCPGLTEYTLNRLGGLSLNGSSDYVDLPNPASNYFDSTAYSVGVFFKADSTSGDRIVFGEGLNYYRFGLGIKGGGKVSGIFKTAGGWDNLNSSASITTGKVNCVVFTTDGSNTSANHNIYINKTVSNGSTGNISPYLTVTVANTAYIGADHDQTRNYFDGTIYEVKVFNKELSSTEVSEYCDEGIGSGYLDANAYHDWKIDENSGSTVYDYGSAAKNGVVSGATWVENKIVRDLNDLTDVNTSTATSGRLLVADGTNWNSVGLTGDCSITSAGNITCAASSAFVDQKIVVFGPNTDHVVEDGAVYYLAGDDVDSLNLTEVEAQVVEAGTTGTLDIDLTRCDPVASGNACSGTTADMLSTNLTVDSGENSSNNAATAAVIDTNYDDISAGDLIRIDIDSVQSVKGKGLTVRLKFQ